MTYGVTCYKDQSTASEYFQYLQGVPIPSTNLIAKWVPVMIGTAGNRHIGGYRWQATDFANEVQAQSLSYGDAGTPGAALPCPTTIEEWHQSLQDFLKQPDWYSIKQGWNWGQVVLTMAAMAVAAWGINELTAASAAAGTDTATSVGLTTGETVGTVTGTAGTITATATTGTAVAATAQTATNTGSTILNDVNNTVSTIANDVKSFLQPITDTINSITKTIQNVNDNLIQPILKPIQTIESEYSTLVGQINTDLQEGLKGLVKIPQQISDALSNVDASLSRSMQQLGTFNANIAKDILAPAMYEAGTKPLGDMNATLSGKGNDELYAAAYDFRDKIREDPIPANITEMINKFEETVKGTSGWTSTIIQYLWGALYVVPYLALQVENNTKPYEHEVKKNAPHDALGVGDVINAWRRDIMGDNDALDEIARNGINSDRAQILYDLAQFLFSPSDAVNLKARGLIDEATYNTLIRQNNLSAGQSDSLEKLLQFIYGPAEAAQLKLRGYVDQQTYLNMQAANLMNEADALTTLLLSIRPVNSSLYLAMQGRIHAKEQGFLSESFNSAPDEAVKVAFEHESKNDQEANLEQLAHWRMPPPEWWIAAFFRKIRTRTECYHAFEAMNVPKEIWDDLFIVEQAYPSVFQLPSMLGAGALDAQTATDVLEKLGFPEDLIQPFIDFGLQGAKTTKAGTAADLASLSLGNAKTLFDDGVLNEDQYKEVLLEHGYSDEAATLTVDVAVIAQQTKARADYAAYLVNEVKLGGISVDDAVTQLYDNNYSTPEVAKYQLQMLSAQQSNTKLPSRSDLAKMAKKGLIADDLWLSMLQVLGYSEQWAQLIIQIDG